jgi:hypothetical protein
MQEQTPTYPCPCCGYIVFHEQSGSCAICPICFWEDDGYQMDDLREAGGANQLSLIDCQRNYFRFGACEKRLLPYVRAPLPDEKRDEGWRPIDADLDFVDLEIDYQHGDPYYWRPTYWKRVAIDQL